MTLPTDAFIAFRFLREGRFQTVLIVAGVSVGVAVIVFLTALIDGLQTSLIDQTLGSQAHVIVRPPERVVRPQIDGDAIVDRTIEKAPQRLQSIEDWPLAVRRIEALPRVVGVSPEVSGSGFAIHGDASRAIALRGIQPERFEKIVDVRDHMKAGTFLVTSTETVIGTELADDLGVGLGDRVRIETPEGRRESFRIAGIFDLGNQDVNRRWVLVPLRSAQTLLDLVGGASVIEVAVDQIFQADAVADQIRGQTGLDADPWTKINAQLMTGLRSQSSSSLLIQVFVVAAVALGIASVLVVTVVQKSREIGILKAYGTSTGRVMRVFLFQGGAVGLLGSVLGAAMGGGLAVFFAHVAQAPGGGPLFPVDLNTALFVKACLIATGTGLVSAVAPARRAARLDPAVVIRYG